MSNSNDEDIERPYPKDSTTLNVENIPKESLNPEKENNQEKNNDNNGINKEIENNEIDNNFPDNDNNNNNHNNDEDNFPPAKNDFDNYINNLNTSKNNEIKEDNFNDDFNADNTFKDEQKNNNDNEHENENEHIEHNDDSLRFSNMNNYGNNDNNRKSDINNKNEEPQENNIDNKMDNDEEFEGDNGGQNNINNNMNDNNNNNDMKDNNENYNNNNLINDSLGFRESEIKNDNNNSNHFDINDFDLDNNNINNDNYNKEIRNSNNSENLQMNPNNENQTNNEQNNITGNGNYLRNKPNLQNNNFNNNCNFNNNNNNLNNINNYNNNFNYSRNPYSNNNNNNNYYQNGGFGGSMNVNQTATHFIPQDTHVINNLNYNYGSSINNNEVRHHGDYNPIFEQYEELPEDSDGFHIDPNKKGKDSSTVAGIQIANTIMGAGILSIPIIMSYLGFLLGISIVVFLAVTTIYSVYILIRCHEITGKNGYSMFGKIALGKIGSIIVKIIIIINNLGICICYFRIFGEVIQTIVQTWVSSNSYWVTNWHNYIYILFGSVIMLAFIFIKNISSLKKVSFLGVIAVLVFTLSLAVLLFYKSASNKLDSDINWKFLFPNCTFTEAFHSTPTVFVAFLFQFNVFPIYYSMKNRNMQSMIRASIIGVIYSLIIFLVVGILGFLLYGLNIDDTILDNLSDDMIKYRSSNVLIIILIIIICVSFIITCLTSFPILFLSLRVNYVNAFLVCTNNCKKNNEDNTQNVPISQGRYQKKRTLINEKVLIIVTIILYVFIVALAILIYKLKTMFTIVGASAGTFIAFILPNLFYIMIVKMSGKNYSLIIPFILFGIGLFFFVIAILLIFF